MTFLGLGSLPFPNASINPYSVLFRDSLKSSDVMPGTKCWGKGCRVVCVERPTIFNSTYQDLSGCFTSSIDIPFVGNTLRLSRQHYPALRYICVELDVDMEL